MALQMSYICKEYVQVQVEVHDLSISRMNGRIHVCLCQSLWERRPQILHGDSCKLLLLLTSLHLLCWTGSSELNYISC